MTEYQLFCLLLIAVFAVAGVSFVSLLAVAAPYGRHAHGGWGPRINDKLGWVIMESPAVIGFALWYAIGEHSTDLVPLIFFTLWEAHYVQRGFIYPLRLRSKKASTTIFVMLSGFTFNLVNGYLNGRTLSHFGSYPTTWLADPRLVIGIVLFVVGYGINRWADEMLRNLRKPGESGYRIPRGGLYEWISCPNYFGEILEWSGWALATWSWAGLSFAVLSASNLIPRALANHRWYQEQFPDYPPQRRAIVPFLF